jgi:hypothetical protein
MTTDEATPPTFAIIKEGTITVRPDGQLFIEGFTVNGTMADLEQEVYRRLEVALARRPMPPRDAHEGR